MKLAAEGHDNAVEGTDIECRKAKCEVGPYEVPLEEICQEEHFG